MKQLIGAAALLALSCMVPASQAQEEDSAAQPSVIAPLAVKSLLIDLAWAGKRAIAVGERGHILYSDDDGRSWTQVQAPVSANLTAVYFADDRQGWAVGHDEVILRTEDGGLNWERVHFNPDANRPLLDVWFSDEGAGLAVGAYGAMYRSEDWGRSWTEAPFEPEPLADEPSGDDGGLDGFEDGLDMGFEFHLNGIGAGDDGVLYLAAEAGRLFRSDDAGTTWRELPSPYDGSFYGVLPLDGETVLAFGLRGNVFRSEDGGQSWTAVETNTVALLNSALRPSADVVIIAGLTGVMLVSQDGGRTFAFSQQEDRKALSGLLWAGDGEVIVGGEVGVRRLPVPGLR
jgi:photosystem II stability/assembly factor-like uncharacterized protein